MRSVLVRYEHFDGFTSVFDTITETPSRVIASFNDLSYYRNCYLYFFAVQYEIIILLPADYLRYTGLCKRHRGALGLRKTCVDTRHRTRQKNSFIAEMREQKKPPVIFQFAYIRG